MPQVNTPNKIFDEQCLDAQFASCLHKLNKLKHMIATQHWHHIMIYTAAYEEEVDKLKQICASFSCLSPRCAEKFQQLYRQQRLVMRAISQAQKNTRESLSSTEQGMHQLQKLACAAQALPS